MTPRAEFLNSVIGSPWHWKSYNCWMFAALVQQELFGRILPVIALPETPSWKWMVREIDGHPERDNWIERPEGPHGLVAADDGALVLMGRLSKASEVLGHIGIWLRPEQSVIHCDRDHGVCKESVIALHQQGWTRRRFFEPRHLQSD